MKKALIMTTIAILCTANMFPTIITNTNQSAVYIRLLARNASMDIDGVYYNPAGLVHLENGWHLALHNQTVFQEKTVVNAFPFLNNSEYVGKVNVPVFPNFYAVYKMNRFALSFGFGPNSGGGTADFDTGLPSFETQISLLPTMLNQMGLPTSQYSVDIAFKGKSIFFGYQINGSYAISDMISAAFGLRLISATNTYEGYIRDISINSYHPLINPAAQLMSAAQFFTIAGMPGQAASVSDKSVDVKQKGSAITPILSLNIRPADNWNIALRYEFNTNLELTNETSQDDTGMFPDGYTFRNDIPAILSLGMEYAILKEFRAMLSFNMFFDKNADWSGSEALVDTNSYDVAFGLEYDLNTMITISGGYMHTQVGVMDEYQSDFSHELSSDAFAVGARLNLKNNLKLDLGILYVNYANADRTILYPGIGSFAETYKRTSLDIAVGIGYNF